MDDQHINTMVVIRNLLEQEASSEKKECSFFLDIYKKVQIYIETYCQHELVEDLIDIDLDRSKTIVYCSKCETTFS